MSVSVVDSCMYQALERKLVSCCCGADFFPHWSAYQPLSNLYSTIAWSGLYVIGATDTKILSTMGRCDTHMMTALRGRGRGVYENQGWWWAWAYSSKQAENHGRAQNYGCQSLKSWPESEVAWNLGTLFMLTRLLRTVDSDLEFLRITWLLRWMLDPR